MVKSPESLKKQPRTERPRVAEPNRKPIPQTISGRAMAEPATAEVIEKEWKETLHEGWYRGK